MDYISTKAASEKWGVHIRVVQDECKSGRVAGAVKHGNSWLIPSSAEKPSDPRIKRKPGQPGDTMSLPRACPVLMFTPLYSIPGSGDGVAASLSGNPRIQRLFSSQLAYFRGDFVTAGQTARELLSEADDPGVYLGCLFILSLCAMYEGDIHGWTDAVTRMEKLGCRLKEVEAVRDFLVGSSYSGLSSVRLFPEWFRHGDFSLLPPDCYPMARFSFLKYLMLSRGNPSDSELCRPYIYQNRVEGALLSEIYCSIMIAVGYHDRGDYKTASEILDSAIEKALPDRLLSPFAEYRTEFGILMDERFAAADKNALAELRHLNKTLLSGWAVVSRKIRGIEYSTTLTQRELHVAKLAAKGLKNAEIARRMNLSPNTVKRYISEAISKTGAPSRDSLSDYIGIENKTLP